MIGKFLCFRLALNLIVNKTFNMNLFNLHYLFSDFLNYALHSNITTTYSKKEEKSTKRNRFFHEVFATIGLVIVPLIEVLLSFLNTWLLEKLYLFSRAIKITKRELYY